MFRLGLTLIAVLTVLACGGGGSSTSGGGGGGGNGSLTFEQKQATITDISNKLVSLGNLSQDQRRAQFVAWAPTQPNIRAAGISAKGDNLYVTFTDGVDFPILDNMRPVTPVRAATRSITRRIPDLPQGLKAWTGHSLGGKPFAKRNTDIQGWLDSHGYQVVNEEQVTVEKIKSGWTGAGVVYWEAHMGSLPIKDGLEDMILLTDEVQTKARDAALKAYIDRYEVGIGGFSQYDADGKLIKVLACYAITPTFIRRHVVLQPNALVAMMGCTSGDRTVKDAFVVAKAGTFIGNSAPAFGRMPNQYAMIFDRLLGTNATDPKEKPEERPYNMVAVQEWMQNKAYILDPDIVPNHTRAQITWSYKSGEEAYILRPTIFRVLREANGAGENFLKWLIEGDFGPDRGRAQSRVEWGGVGQEVVEWTPQHIKVKIPKGGTYPTGNLEVITQDRRSNVVPLTQWTLPFTYTLTGKGTLKITVTGSFIFRGDMRANRNMPEEQLQTGAGVVLTTLLDSRATLTASGSYKEGNTTYTWSGTRTLASFDVNPPATNFMSFSGNFNKETFNIELCTVLGSAMYKETVKTSTSTVTNDVGFGFDGFFTPFTVPVTRTSYAIEQKSIPVGTIVNPRAVTASFVLGPATPVFAPTDKTQSRPW